MSSLAIRSANVAIAFFNVIALIFENFAIAAPCDSNGCAAPFDAINASTNAFISKFKKKKKKEKRKKKVLSFLSFFSNLARQRENLFVLCVFFFQLIKKALPIMKLIDTDRFSIKETAADCGVAAASHALTKSSLSGAMLRFFMMAP
jgi:hypothetical protein